MMSLLRILDAFNLKHHLLPAALLQKPLAFGIMALVRIYVTALLILVFWPQVNNRRREAPQLYRRYCVSCHGMDGTAKTSKGKFSHARNLTDPQWRAEVTDERIFNSIMNGRNVRGNMPAFSNKLNEREVNSLVVFVRQLKPIQQ